MDFSENIVRFGDSIANLNSVDLKSLFCYLNHVYGIRLTSVIAPNSVARKIKTDRDSYRYDVRLKSCGENKFNAIKALRELTNVSLADARTIVESSPIFIKIGVREEEAVRFKRTLEQAGCLAEFVPSS